MFCCIVPYILSKKGEIDMKVFDGHCDTISRATRDGSTIRKTGGHLDLERMGAYEGWAQLFAIFAPMGYVKEPMWDIFQRQAATFQKEMEANADMVVQCRTAGDIERAWAAGKSAAILSVEGAELVDCDLDKLQIAYDLGARAMNLTWNFTNKVSGTNKEGADLGLTDHGKVFVKKMQELGMLVDVSHLSDPGFWDVVELSAQAGKPFFASHSNSRAICPHSRNLTDEMFLALRKSGGVAGLNMCADFVGEDPDMDTLIAHIEHWCALGGQDAIAMGGDWDGIQKAPMGIDGIQDVEKLAERLLGMNYSQETVDGILYKNFLRTFRAVCG